MFSSLFVTFIYQPFFNLLIFFYWLADVITAGNANMGIAVIMLALSLRLLLLPLSIRGMKTEHQRIAISKKIEEIEQLHSNDPVVLQQEKKAVLKAKPKLVFAEVLNLFLQIMVALIVWQIFQTGLKGDDLPLLYPFPLFQEIALPFNLMFWGFDLSERSVWLVLWSILLLFIMETISVLAAPAGSLSRSRALKAQLIIPIVSFFLFLFMPAGKVLFLITTFSFSIVLGLYKLFFFKFEEYKEKKSLPQENEEKVLVETK